MLASENLTLRFGSFQYREDTGEIRYAYSFLAMENIPKDDLDIYVQCVLQASLNMFDKLRKYSSGHFDDAETYFIPYTKRVVRIICMVSFKKSFIFITSL